MLWVKVNDSDDRGSHPSRAEAEAELADYVRRSWDAEMGEDPLPDDPAQMIDEYFTSVLETYEISEVFRSIEQR